MYMGFLMSEPTSTTCTQLSEVMGISHDSVNRFLSRESYEPRDLFNESMALINPKNVILSVDDSVLDKPYSQHMALVGYFWSGKHHRTVKGLNLVTLYAIDSQGRHAPVNYRIVDKSEGKTKNDYFQEMFHEVLAWGLKPKFVTGDSWYSCTQNLKMVRKHLARQCCSGFLFGVESNRRISVEKGSWQQIRTAAIPEEGCMVWLRDFGDIKVFRTQLKDQLRHYIIWLPSPEAYAEFGRESFQQLHDDHWRIEQYHRMIKQVCHIERFQVRGRQLIMNHIFSALCAYVHLQRMQINDFFSNAYRWQRALYTQVVRAFVTDFSKDRQNLNPIFAKAVNA